MRFLMIYRADPSTQTAPDPAHMAAMDRYIAERARSGVLLTTGGLKPGSKRVRLQSGVPVVMDGPFAEAKEVICGFAVVELASEAAAVAAATEFLKLAGPGVSEIHALYSPEDFGRTQLPELKANEERGRAELARAR